MPSCFNNSAGIGVGGLFKGSNHNIFKAGQNSEVEVETVVLKSTFHCFNYQPLSFNLHKMSEDFLEENDSVGLEGLADKIKVCTYVALKRAFLTVQTCSHIIDILLHIIEDIGLVNVAEIKQPNKSLIPIKYASTNLVYVHVIIVTLACLRPNTRMQSLTLILFLYSNTLVYIVHSDEGLLAEISVNIFFAISNNFI